MEIKLKTVVETMIEYFTNKGWSVQQCKNGSYTCLHKDIRNFMYLQYCKLSIKKQRIQSCSINGIIKITDEIEKYLYKKRILRPPSIPIWDSRTGNIFVGSGLEYIFLPAYVVHFPTVLFQPSIRLRGGIHYIAEQVNNRDSLSSFAFVNVSILHRVGKDQEKHASEVLEEYTYLLDEAISLLSHVGLHASRLELLLDLNLHVLQGGNRSIVTKILSDGVEIGDHVLLIRPTGDLFIETGFGLERMVSRVLHLPYWCVIYSPYARDDVLLLKVMHVLGLFVASSVPYTESAAWNKIRAIASLIREKIGTFDSFLLFSDMYSLWSKYINKEYISNKTNAYLQLLSLLLKDL